MHWAWTVFALLLFSCRVESCQSPWQTQTKLAQPGVSDPSAPQSSQGESSGSEIIAEFDVAQAPPRTNNLTGTSVDTAATVSPASTSN